MKFIIKSLLLAVMGIVVFNWLSGQGILDLKINKCRLKKVADYYTDKVQNKLKERSKASPSDDKVKDVSDEQDYIELCQELKDLSTHAIKLRQKLLEHYSTVKTKR